jgi:hypothetical protein
MHRRSLSVSSGNGLSDSCSAGSSLFNVGHEKRTTNWRELRDNDKHFERLGLTISAVIGKQILYSRDTRTLKGD